MSSTRYTGVENHIGKTPLIRLRRLSELTSCEILGKAEFMNPGGSVKDRAALGIILDAESDGQLRPGDTIVEGTAGNTGIGLTVVGHAKGYRTVIVIPETQAPEKISLLRTLGATVLTVPEKPYSDPGNYNHIARNLAAENGWFWANQFDNTANRHAHFTTTGPEIWDQTTGEVSAFVAAIGTGGTLAGTGLYLKEQRKEIALVCADPYGAAMWSWFTHGHANIKDGESYAEGIGQTRVTKNLEDVVVDRAYRVTDQSALTAVYHLLRDEGLFLGLSSGKPSSRSSVTQDTNTSRSSLIKHGWQIMIFVRTAPLNRSWKRSRTKKTRRGLTCRGVNCLQRSAFVNQKFCQR
jgi:cysteine synthase A